MPWKEANSVSLRHDFVLRALEPDVNFSALCREFNVSRKTGYKWVRRYKERGTKGLDDLDRGPAGAHPLRTSPEVAIEILAIRHAHPTWGPKKIRAVLRRQLPAEGLPSVRTVARVLLRAGVVRSPKRRRRKVSPAKKPELSIEACNQLWTVDFKGWWTTTQGQRAEPLTVRDQFSRFVLAVRVLPNTSRASVQPVFQELFERYGVPEAILSDNGSPFASQGLTSLTKLSAWWVSLGIRVLRSRPGKPQDNGAHERMHRDIKAELQNHPAWNLSQQQQACDRWRSTFNNVRPHEALEQEPPASVYRKSPRLYDPTPRQVVYPADFAVRRVQKPGTIRYQGFQRHVSTALAGYDVGIEPLDGPHFRVWFGYLCLGVGRLPWTAPLRPPGPDVPSL